MFLRGNTFGERDLITTMEQVMASERFFQFTRGRKAFPNQLILKSLFLAWLFQMNQDDFA